MPASTPRTCLRRESDEIHSHTSSHASSRGGRVIQVLYPSPHMEKFVIQGGEPLSGEITVAGNKNAALPIIAASLLTEEEAVLSNVPRIRDTEAQVGLLESIGVRASWDPSD